MMGAGYFKKFEDEARPISDMPIDDYCHKIELQLVKLQKELADQREERRFQAACAAMSGLLVEGSYNKWADMASDSVNCADALLAELEKKEDI